MNASKQMAYEDIPVLIGMLMLSGHWIIIGDWFIGALLFFPSLLFFAARLWHITHPEIFGKGE